MGEYFNIYCDESCHLENDRVNNTAMVIGGIICPDRAKKDANNRIREIKNKHNIATNVEIKWNKVSPAQLNYYLDLINYFFDNSELSFCAIIVPNKQNIKHRESQQTHDDFYYKMYFEMLKTVLEPGNEYAIYIDIKDTRSQQKVNKLKDALSSSHYDFNRNMVKRIQQIRSHEVELMGLADLLIGGLSYLHRGLTQSEAKTALINCMKERSKYSLTNSTLYRENKFNLLVWRPENANA